MSEMPSRGPRSDRTTTEGGLPSETTGRPATSSGPREHALAAALWPITAAVNESDHLVIGGCDVVELVARHGTPLYVLDEDTFRDNCRRYLTALRRHYPADSGVQYASKALLNTAIAQLALAEGLGLDVVSGGELFIALHAGAAPAAVHFHGNAKTAYEIEEALRLGVGRIVVDNMDELEQLCSLARRSGRSLQLSLRIVPDVAAATHAHIQTGHGESKFGLALGMVDRALEVIRTAHAVRLTGLHFHLGSQISAGEPYERALEVVLNLAARLRKHGVTIEELSPGGGLGVAYAEADPTMQIESFVERLASWVKQGCRSLDLPLPRLVLEPGRSISARAGVALYSIVGSKALPPDVGARRYLHVDGGMADNIRPALYGARYIALLANGVSETAEDLVHLSGRYCESSDVLIRGVRLPVHTQRGDLIAIPVAGAYTLSMASNYNGALRPEVLLVADGNATVIQRRETYADLVRRDLPLWQAPGYSAR